jgi:hypothetical protein
MLFTLNKDDIENINKYQENGYFNAFVSKSEKTGLPYLSFSPREDLPPPSTTIHDQSPFNTNDRVNIKDIPF